MSYLVLARRFRPQTFDEIVGQEHVTRTLKNAITSDRVAHAFLFTGARGVGKTTGARVLAKALNCVNGPTTTPCGVCEQCVSIAESRAVDVQEIDGASNNSVEDVRALRETVPYQPSSARFKIYIVDEVHMLTQSAFNALLKTLEEPPPHVKFIFATTEPHKIPITILSRCQRYDFRLVPTMMILERLEKILAIEGVTAEPAALSLLAREARGSMRDALSLLDQALAFSTETLEAATLARLLGVADRQILFQVSGALLDHDAAAALRAVDRAATFGCDLPRFAQDVLAHLRNLVVAAQCPNERDLIDLADDELAEVRAQVEGREVAELHRLFLLFSRAVEEIARAKQPRLVLEMTLARLASLEPMRSLELLSRQLERLAAGSSPRGGGPSRGGPVTLVPSAGGSLPGGAPPAGRQALSDQPAPQAAPIVRTPPRAVAEPSPPPPRPAAEEPPPPSDADAPEAPLAGAPKGDLQPDWRRLLETIKSTSQPLFHVLRFAEPVTLSPRGVALVVPDEPFFRSETENPKRREALAEACRRFFGVEVPVRFEVATGPTHNATAEMDHIEAAAREHDRRREAMEHGMVRAALSEFEGAKIAKIRLFEGRDR